MTTPRYACPHCGYDLDAVPAGAGGVTCPECGNVEPAAPYALAPWPSALRIAILMLWPTASLLMVVGLLATLRHLAWLLWIGWSLAIMAWFMAAIVHPLFESGELARRHALVPNRDRVRGLLGAGGIGANIMMTLLLLWIGVRILG